MEINNRPTHTRIADLLEKKGTDQRSQRDLLKVIWIRLARSIVKTESKVHGSE